MGNTNGKNEVEQFVDSIPVTKNGYQWKAAINEINLKDNKYEYDAIKQICSINYKIEKIEKVVNEWIFLRYTGQKLFLQQRDNIEPNELLVFHGSVDRDPHNICSHETGLDFRIDKKGNDNTWGNGIHFSTNPFYAISNAKASNNKCSIIIAKMLIGSLVYQTPEENNDNLNLKLEKVKNLPPLVDGEATNENFIKFIRYDLVTGVTNNTQRVFVYYENYYALPLYIVTFNKNELVKNFSMLERWFWIDEVGTKCLIPNEANNEIEMSYKKGKLNDFSVKFKLRQNYEEAEYEVNLSKHKNESYLENKENKKRIPINKKYLHSGNLSKDDKGRLIDTKTDNIIKMQKQFLYKDNTILQMNRKTLENNKLEQKFYTNLEKDIDILQNIFKNYEFYNEIGKKEILGTIETLSEMNIESRNEIKYLEKDDPEYTKVEKQLQETIKDAEIVYIQKIKNNLLLIKYLIQRVYIALKSNVINEKQLFHGTRKTSPENIYRDMVGFDMRYSNKGFWGRANYFAVNASYSDNGYTYCLNSGERQLFLADVIIGKHTDRYKESEQKRDLLEPPLIKNSNERYDSVYANTGGSDVYMVYENNRAYPKYLITYKKL